MAFRLRDFYELFQVYAQRLKLNKSSAVAEMGDRLATIDMGRKVGVAVCAPFRGGQVGPINLWLCNVPRITLEFERR